MIKYIVFIFVSIITKGLYSQELAIQELNNTNSKGWSIEIKNQFMASCLNGYTEGLISDKYSFCNCIFEKMQQAYSFEKINNLAPNELSDVEDVLAEICLNETGEIVNIKNNEIDKAIELTRTKHYNEAIDLYLSLIDKDNTDIRLYNNLGFCYLVTKQFANANVYLKEAEKLDNKDLIVRGNLAHLYLLNGDYENAKLIYIKYKSQIINSETSWKSKIINDFIQFRENGIENDRFNLIIDLIK